MQHKSNKRSNSLINETSPYLLQHAFNPVEWFPFGPEVFEKARRENKPMLLSIGYSACHWCHVMEKECFEDEEVAALMNENFVNVKIDREERGDVDMLYMQAVQLMTGHGGWPLNCFVLPDGRPFYGGTYFPRTNWMNILRSLADIYTNHTERVLKYAAELTQGIKQSELLTTTVKEEKRVDKVLLRNSVSKWKRQLNNEHGGANHAPKFPMPSNYRFLLRYAVLENDTALLSHVNLTLAKMACGGIYDQLHGGFARYSTDVLWKVPHFEKMLYDNAQLISLYCEAYTLTGNELYKEIALRTLNFVSTEWYNEEGFFYSAYDADSEGEEGKYYVWKREQLEELLGNEYALFCKYYRVNDEGYWESGNYILMRVENLVPLLAEFEISREELEKKINACKEILKREAAQRIKPGLDDKTITAWNAMMCSAYAQAYLCFGTEKLKQTALASAMFINGQLSPSNKKLSRSYKNGHWSINAFLDDYAFTIEAQLNCYLISHNEYWLNEAEQLCRFCLNEFHNSESDLLFYTGKSSQQLVVRTSEVSDNVIPASNSQMALNLFYLGTHLCSKEWIERSQRMLKTVLPTLLEYGAGYSNWACLALHLAYPLKEIVIVGNNVDENLLKLYQHGLTNTILATGEKPSELPLLKNRFVENQTTIYVCENNTCGLPVTSVESALKLLV